MEIRLFEQSCNLADSDAALYGNKAYVLEQLINSFNVPKGFALSSVFFDTFLKGLSFPYSSADYYAKNIDIQTFIYNSQFSATQETEIINAIANCGLDLNCKFVVRSSANCEDQSKTSMAGVFESFVNLPSIDDIFDSIKKCYCSLFSERALSYYDLFDIDILNLKMSVIVQEYIEGLFSGVVFTADTKTHDLNFMFINFVQGKCSDFVDSSKQSYFIKVDKRTMQIIETNKSTSKESSLPDTIISQLMQVAVGIEKVLGYPSDIEWTYDGKEIYILQARPITTLKYERFSYEASEEDKKYNWFLAEQYPIKPLLENFFHMSFAHRGEGIRKTGYGSQNGVLKQLNGYMYIGVGALENENELRETALARLKNLTDNNIGIFHDIILLEILSMKNQMDSFLYRQISNSDAAELLAVAVSYSNFIDTAHWDSVLGEEYIENFHQYVCEICMNLSTEELYNLIYCKTKKTQEREMLFRISDFLKDYPDMISILNSSSYPKIVYERLKITKHWSVLKKIIDEYIDTFGMQKAGSKNNPSNTLREKPQYIIDKIKTCILQDSSFYKSSIIDLHNKKEAEIKRILELILNDKKKEFLGKLSLAEKTFASIDDHHYYCEDMSWGYVKTAITEAGKQLVRMSKIDTVDDIYFLEFDEIYGLLKEEIQSIDINIRKKKYAKQEKMLPPQPLFCVDKVENTQAANNDIIKEEAVTILKGVSSLSKIVEGTVFVTYGIPDHLEEKCILVVRNGHGGDLFSVAEKLIGLIVTGGSPFDHMGIITREMNIPAVYYVSNAFDVLKTGDNVILNGEEGTITVSNNS